MRSLLESIKVNEMGGLDWKQVLNRHKYFIRLAIGKLEGNKKGASNPMVYKILEALDYQADESGISSGYMWWFFEEEKSAKRAWNDIKKIVNPTTISNPKDDDAKKIERIENGDIELELGLDHRMKVGDYKLS